MENTEGDGQGECRLLEGVPAYLAQVMLFAFVVVSLFIKRILESPQRTMKVWIMDVSKQALSALAAHLCNMLAAILAAGFVKKSQASECSWYFIVYSVDTSIGVSIAILLHKVVVSAARRMQQNSYSRLQVDSNPIASWDQVIEKRWFEHIARCGYYGDPPSLKPWLWQISEWTLITIIARVICGSLVVLLGRYGLVLAAGLLDKLFKGHPHALLAFVMVLCPVVMNIAQALIQDTVLKWRRSSKGGKIRRFVDSEQEVIEIVNDGWSDGEM